MNNKNKQSQLTVRKTKKRPITKREYDAAVRLTTKKMTKVLLVFFVGLLLLATVQVFSLQVFHRYKGVNLTERSKQMYDNKSVAVANRGVISDAQGNELAININTYDMYAILDPEYKSLDGQPFFVEDKEKTANELLQTLGLSDNQQARQLFIDQLNADAKQVEFGSYGKNLNLEQKQAIDNLKLPGIAFTEVPTRYYPYGDFAPYAVGYAKYNDQGQMVGEIGIEKALDGYLRGQNGEVVQSLDAHGIPIDGQSPITIVPKADGSNVKLTIDANIQALVQEEMQKALKDRKYDLAYTMITDTHSGEILAMYSLPTFDPNKRDVKNYLDPFTEYCFEPGSTIKTFLIAEAMERGIWDPNRQVKTGQTTRPNWGNTYIADWLYNKHKTSWGMLEWNKGYYLSSNTVMMDILDNIGYENWLDALKNKWEFGKPVDTRFIKSEKCDVSPTQPLEYATSAFGQGITSDAMQMSRAYSAFGNDGVMVTPHLVKEITDANTGEIIYNDTDDKTLQTKQVISKETAKSVVNEMHNAVTYQENLPYRRGTGYLADGGSVPLAIKTGTAQVAGDSGYSSSGGEISSYATLAPADDPQFFMYTVLVNPQASYLDFLGSMVRNMAEKTTNYLQKKSNGINVSQDTNRVALADYTNQPISDVAQQLLAQGLTVSVLGEGNVVKQYPAPNQVISKNQQIILRGSGDVDPQSLVNKPIGEAQGICSIMDWNCQFNGTGNVTAVVDNGNGIYNIDCALPPQVNDELTQRRQPKQ